jgi:hypothetical protein
MSIDAEVYAAVLHHLAAGGHGWGRPYDFQDWYVLDHTVPGVETEAEFRQSADVSMFDDAMKSALQAKSADLPPLSFVHNIHDVYDASRQGPVQVRNGGAFVALGPVQTDTGAKMATVGVMFYAGHRWARWIRYHLVQVDSAWSIVSADVLAIS